MTNDARVGTQQEPIPVEDPVSHAKLEIAKAVNKWLVENPEAEVLLVYRMPITALDPKTKEVFIEVRGDLIAKGHRPIENGTVVQEFYRTLGVVKRVIETPEEAAKRTGLVIP
jgi:hypothetical protein